VFNRVDRIEINGINIMREFSFVTNGDIILEIGSEFNLFELPTVASA